MDEAANFDPRQLGTDQTFRDASPAQWPLTKRFAAAKAFRALPRLALKAVNFGQLAEYITWQESTFGRTKLYRNRESLWAAIMPHVNVHPLLAVELGVAWGYATNWWLSRLPQSDLEWHGYDTFTGLPDAYRAFPAGAFDAGGTPPAIADSRLRWHVGLVEETLTRSELARSKAQQMLVLFDLDLHSPSLFAWRELRPLLKPGDILYFDEAWDENERRLLVEEVLPAYPCRALGATTQSLALMLQ